MVSYDEFCRTDAESRGVPIISRQGEIFLSNCLSFFSPQRLCEIGSAEGYSSRFFGRYLVTRCGVSADIVGFEVSLPAYLRACLEAKAYVQQFPGLSLTYYPFDITKISDHYISLILHGQYDMLFLDARKRSYGEYLTRLSPFLHKNSVIICDDVVKFHHKMEPLYIFLEKMQRNRVIFDTRDGDGMLVASPSGRIYDKLIQYLVAHRSIIPFQVVGDMVK